MSGTAQSIDGDSLRVDGKEVRLFGIDAPEFHQTCQRGAQNWACGAEAANRLSQLVAGKAVQCVSVGVDKHGRVLGRCTAAGIDVNRTMVATGYAVAFRRYSMDYISAEESAKVARRGIWAGTFEMPSEVRQADQQPEPTPSYKNQPMPVVLNSRSKPQPNGDCRIKGNRGRNGWIYHVPGMPYYAATVAEEIFCTEAQARAAGYRRARAR